MKKYKWYRKLIGGCWIYDKATGWQRTTNNIFKLAGSAGAIRSGMAVECYE